MTQADFILKILLHWKNHSVSSWNKTDKREHVHIYFLKRGKGCWGNGEVTGACLYRFKRKKNKQTPNQQECTFKLARPLSVGSPCDLRALCGEQAAEPPEMSSASTSLQWVRLSRPTTHPKPFFPLLDCYSPAGLVLLDLSYRHTPQGRQPLL